MPIFNVDEGRCAEPRCFAEFKNIDKGIVLYACARELMPPSRPIYGAFPLASHHIIPFSLLRDTWRKMFFYFNIQTLYRVINLYCATGPSGYLAFRDYIKKCKDKFEKTYSSSERFEGLQRRDIGLGDEWNMLGEIISWPHWNIIIGPRIRSDDPVDNYDDFYGAYTILRKCPLVLKKLEKIKMYYDSLNVVLSITNKIQAKTVERSFNTILDQVSNQLISESFGRFDSRIWRCGRNVRGDIEYEGDIPRLRKITSVLDI